MSWSPTLGMRQLAHQAAAAVFRRAVQDIFTKATGERPHGGPARLIARLARDERLTPEATLHLMAIAEALQQAGEAARDIVDGEAVREHVIRLVPAAERLPFWQRP